MSLLGKWFGFTCEEVFEEAMSQFDMGEYEEAIDSFAQCLDSDGIESATQRLARFYTAESHSQLGKVRLREGQWMAALRHFEAALRLFPSYPDLNLNASRACRALGAKMRAREYLDRCLEVNPRFPEAIVFDGVLLYDEGHRDSGLSRCEEAHRMDGSLGADRLAEAQSAHRMGDYAGCLVRLIEMAASVAADATLHARVADSFFRDGQLEEAATEYRKAASIAPGFADVRCKLGRVLIAMGRPSEALEQLREAVRINPAYADAYAQAGLAYRLLGNGLEAIAAFQKAIGLSPDHPIASQELRRVRGYVS